MIGIGATVIEELVIGKGAVVAAGAMVLGDVKERTMVAGIPAIVKKTYEERPYGTDLMLDKIRLLFPKYNSGVLDVLEKEYVPDSHKLLH